MDTGIMAEPMLRAWIQEPLPAGGVFSEIPGRWVAESQWPPVAAAARSMRSTWAASTSSRRPRWRCRSKAFRPPGGTRDRGAPTASRPTGPAISGRWTASSVTFESDPLAERFEILGYPEVTLELTSDRPNALVVVRLCEVAPDGSSTLVTRALQNLTHRDSDEFPEPLEPGKRYRVKVRLDACGHAFAAGNRIRVGVSATYWPWAWPSPEAATLTIYAGASRLSLPIRPPKPADGDLAPFSEPEESPPLATELLSSGPAGRDLTRDLSTGRQRLVYDWDVGGVTGCRTAWNTAIPTHHVRDRRRRSTFGRSAVPHDRKPGPGRLADPVGVRQRHDLRRHHVSRDHHVTGL